MSSLSTPSRLADLIRRLAENGLADADALETWMAQQPSDAQTDRNVTEILKQLVADKLLTPFQAARFAAGQGPYVLGGRFRVLAQIGAGGMGRVYRCEHLVMRNIVAVKVLSPEVAAFPGARERFRREAQASAALSHPNVVRALEMDPDGSSPFLVMEYVDGVDLHTLVAKRGRLPIRAACEYARQAALGLAHAHERGLVHRDVKPANLLLDKSGTVKVLDLGLALFSRVEMDELTRKHNTEGLLGTIDYLAPEQALDGHNVDSRVDVYGLGASLYYLLSGKGPFDGKTTLQKVLHHQMMLADPLTDHRPEVPADLAALISTMMAKNPADRFATADEAAEALEPWTRWSGPTSGVLSGPMSRITADPTSDNASVPTAISRGPTSTIKKAAIIRAPLTESDTRDERPSTKKAKKKKGSSPRSGAGIVLGIAATIAIVGFGLFVLIARPFSDRRPVVRNSVPVPTSPATLAGNPAAEPPRATDPTPADDPSTVPDPLPKTLPPPSSSRNLIHGLAAEFYDFQQISRIPDFSRRVPDVVRTDSQILYTEGKSAWIGLDDRFAESFACRHTGFVKIDKPGDYTFYLNSDDGTKMWIGENPVLLIDNDGPHGMKEVAGTVTLPAGYHPIRVAFYQGTSSLGMVLKWSGPGIEKSVVPSTVLFREPPGSGIHKFYVQVAASADDAEEKSDGLVMIDSGDLDMGEVACCGLRFRHLALPPGTTVVGARLQFTSEKWDQKSATRMTIFGEAADDAAEFRSSNGDLTRRRRTSASVDWADLPAWDKSDLHGLNQRSPDLSRIVQEIINRPNWHRGNDLVFLIHGHGGKRSGFTFDKHPGKAPQLLIEASLP